MQLDLVKAVLFDFDGTLVDSMSLLRNIYAEFLQANEVAEDQDDFESLVGASLPEIIAFVKSKYVLTSSISSLHSSYLNILNRSYATKVLPMQGAQMCLQELLGLNCFIGIVTSAPRVLVNTFVNAHSWLGYFNTIVTGDDVQKTKPHPDLYLKMLSIAELEPECAIAVEDSVNGVRAAVSADIRVVGLATNHYSRNSLFKAGVKTIISNLQELSSLFNSQTTAAPHAFKNL